MMYFYSRRCCSFDERLAVFNAALARFKFSSTRFNWSSTERLRSRSFIDLPAPLENFVAKSWRS